MEQMTTGFINGVIVVLILVSCSCLSFVLGFFSGKPKQSDDEKEKIIYNELKSRELNILTTVAIAIDNALANNEEIAIVECLLLPNYDFRLQIIELLKDNGCSLITVTMSDDTVYSTETIGKKLRYFEISVACSTGFIDYDRAKFLKLVHS